MNFCLQSTIWASAGIATCVPNAIIFPSFTNRVAFCKVVWASLTTVAPVKAMVLLRLSATPLTGKVS